MQLQDFKTDFIKSSSIEVVTQHEKYTVDLTKKYCINKGNQFLKSISIPLQDYYKIYRITVVAGGIPILILDKLWLDKLALDNADPCYIDLTSRFYDFIPLVQFHTVSLEFLFTQAYLRERTCSTGRFVIDTPFIKVDLIKYDLPTITPIIDLRVSLPILLKDEYLDTSKLPKTGIVKINDYIGLLQGVSLRTHSGLMGLSKKVY